MTDDAMKIIQDALEEWKEIMAEAAKVSEALLGDLNDPLAQLIMQQRCAVEIAFKRLNDAVPDMTPEQTEMTTNLLRMLSPAPKEP